MQAHRDGTAFLLYLALVVYGSLVPLEFHALPWSTALERFAHTPWLHLGAGSRADWIANLLLYIPLAYLLQAWLAARDVRPPAWRVFLGLAACVAIAVGIEFLQLFFPQRTVSLNDLLAETIGSLLGVAIQLRFGASLSRWLATVRHDDQATLKALLQGWLLVYLALSLFPFDFVVSTGELKQRLASPMVSLLPGAACGGLPRCILKQLLEALMTVPIGILLAMRTAPKRLSSWRVLLLGLSFGGLVETLQLFLVSGVAEGFSIVPKALGIVAGYLVHGRGKSLLQSLRNADFRPLIVLAVLPYLLALAFANRWFPAHWHGGEAARQQWSRLHLLPFYYHYFTTETVALSSTLFTSLLYAPVGIAVALWRKERAPLHWRATLAITLPLVTLMEAGKLFIEHTHAEPSNLLIAPAAALAAQWLTARLVGIGTQTTGKHPVTEVAIPPSPRRAPSPPIADPSPRPPRSAGGIVIGAALSGAGLYTLFQSPVGSAPLLIGAGLLAAAQRRWATTWLIALPALLPVLNLAPWSGRFFWDAWDGILLFTLGLLMLFHAPRQRLRRRHERWLVSALALIWLLAMLRPLWPWPGIDLNAFNNLFSPFNSLRIGKGFFWALLFLPYLAIAARDRAARLALMRGFAIGAALLIAWVLVERQLYSGLLNLSNDFRITGPFSTMNVGGGHIETYLVLLFPLVIYWIILERARWKWLIGAGLLLGLGYALLVTYARAGYGAFAGEILILTLLLAARSWRRGTPRRFAGILLIVVLAAGAFAALLAQSPYARQRMETVSKDFNVRLRHWKESLALMEPGTMTGLFGMGLGQYPISYALLNSHGTRLASYAFDGSRQNPYLKLSSGDTLYFEQIIEIAPHADYHLQLDLRSSRKHGHVTIALCEKAMLYSFQCVWKTLEYQQPAGEWRGLGVTLNSGVLGEGNLLNRRQVKFSIFNPTPGSTIAIDNIRLQDQWSKNLVRNGDFTRTNDFWYFSTDDHLPWHTKQLGVQVFFAQGWLGLLVLTAFVMVVWRKLLRNALKGSLFAIALLSSTAGFLLIGLLSSPFDAPRLTFTFFSLMFLGLHDSATDDDPPLANVASRNTR